jgi:putative heme-binding domain-containing protein
MRVGLEGRYDAAAPPNWPPVFDRLRRSDATIARLANDVAQRFGDADTGRANLEALRAGTGAIEDRRRALQMLTARRQPQLVPYLPALIDDPALRTDAIRAVAAFDDDGLGKLLVTRYPSLSADDKREAVQTFASRARYGRLLTEALARETIPRRDIPPHLARQFRRVVGPKFADVWGAVETSALEDRTLSRYRTMLTDRTLAGADVRNGRAIFQQTCGTCHKMYGEGADIGPDLTGSNRTNLDYLLLNVLNPGADVPDAYRLVIVTTRDGRTFTGTVSAETDRQLTLHVAGQPPAVISTSDIQSREVTATSMMPPGLLDALLDREVIDLVAYLRTMTPVRPR